MSEIRRLLSDAQDAERRGKKDEASRLLRVAAAWYRDRQMLKRAAQMLRQARRVEGVEDEEPEAVFGFDEPEDPPMDSVPGEGRTLVEQREPQLADPSLDAWCSFCCKPKAEVGALVAGPAGAYVCQACVEKSASLLPLPAKRGEGRGAHWEVKALKFELKSQRRARERFTRSRSKLTLVIGPEGSGKSKWLESLGPQSDVQHLELEKPLTEQEEAELLAWLQPAARSAFLIVRAPVPPPALVLQGEHGEEPLHDTASLEQALPQVSAKILAKVDAVISFDLPRPDELASLAQAMGEARGVSLPSSTLTQLVALAEKANRGAHELAVLIARIPPGKYGS